MFRVFFYIISTIFIISLLRGVLGVLAKMFGGMVNPAPERATANPRAAAVPMGGELKKDPICGTYVSTSTAVKKSAPKGEVVYFCSTACRDKFIS
jgi:YHS domain-containing protein